MPELHPSTATLVIERDAVALETRTAAYALANSYLFMHAALAEAFGMQPVKMLLYLTIMVAAVQRVVRSGQLPAGLRAAAPLPLEHTGYISRRALAAATGVSRETVRRVVRELLDDGLITIGPNGGLASQPGVLAQPHVQVAFERILAETRTTSNRLIQLGVFRADAVYPQLQ